LKIKLITAMVKAHPNAFPYNRLIALRALRSIWTTISD
jgi:hypothetical protein